MEKDLFEHSFRHAAIGMALVSPQGRWMKVNPSLCELLGYTEEQLLQTNFQSVTHPDDLANSAKHLEDMRHGRIHLFRGQKRYIHKDGRTIWVSVSATAVRNDYGEPLYFISQIQDLTEQMAYAEMIGRYQDEIAHSKLKFRAVVESANDAIVITDERMRVLTWNAAAQRLFGFDRREMSGQSLECIIPERYREAHRHGVARFLASGESRVIGRTVEMQGLRKDGTEFPLEFSLNTWESGGERFFSAIIRDITERKQAEENYRRLVDELPDALVFAKGERWIYVNDAAVRLLGASSKEEVLSRSVLDTVHPDYHEQVRARIRKVEQERKPFGLSEEKFVRMDGRAVDVEVMSIPAIYDNQPVRCLLVRDVTAQKKTQELIVHSEKLSVAGQLAAGVAHEIRNPLTAIKGFLQLLRPKLTEHARSLDIIFSEIGRIELITNELLVLAKPHPVQFVPRSLGEMVRQVTALLEAEANLCGVQFSTTLDPDGWIECDANQIKQAFINFIKNAMEAMPSGGVLRIDGRTDGGYAYVRFVDSGCGMPEETMRRLGEPFFTTKEKGTGLGLLVSKKIVSNHGGELRVDSRPGEGTTVEVRFPLVAPPASR